MERKDALHFLQAMIDYFEAGNRQTDNAARAIIENDSEYLDNWQAEIRNLKAGGEWTGVRAPEADIVARSLRALQKLLEDRPC